MRTTLACLTAICSVLAIPAVGQPEAGYHILKTYTLGGDGGWDYLNLDPAISRLMVQ